MVESHLFQILLIILQKPKIFLLECIELEKERGRPYFVENEFYKNEYVRGVRGKYFSIKVREISPWLTCNGEYEVKEIKKNKIVKIY